MSTVWKWTLGILAAVVVIGLVVGAVFMWRNHTVLGAPRYMFYSAPAAPGLQQQPGGPGADDGGPTVRRYDREWRMPMMRPYGGYRPYGHPFGFGLMLFGGLLHLILPLALLALVAYIFYQMGKRAGSASMRIAPVAPRPDTAPPTPRKVARR